MNRYVWELVLYCVAIGVGLGILVLLGCSKPQVIEHSWRCAYTDRGPYMTVEKCEQIK